MKNSRYPYLNKEMNPEERYQYEFREIVRKTWRGDYSDDEDELYLIALLLLDEHIRNGMTQAFYEGALEMGVQPNEITIIEQTELYNAIREQQNYVPGFLAYVIEHSKANGYKFTPILQLPRTQIWLNQYGFFRDTGRTTAKDDPKMRWETHSMEQCGTCGKLDGWVARLSFWQENVMPRDPRLECMASTGTPGVPVCKCELVPTDEPITPGRFPDIP